VLKREKLLLLKLKLVIQKIKEKEKTIRQYYADNPEQDEVRKYIESKGLKFSSLDTKNPSFPRSILPPEAETPKAEPKKAEATKTEEKKQSSHH